MLWPFFILIFTVSFSAVYTDAFFDFAYTVDAMPLQSKYFFVLPHMARCDGFRIMLNKLQILRRAL